MTTPNLDRPGFYNLYRSKTTPDLGEGVASGLFFGFFSGVLGAFVAFVSDLIGVGGRGVEGSLAADGSFYVTLALAFCVPMFIACVATETLLPALGQKKYPDPVFDADAKERAYREFYLLSVEDKNDVQPAYDALMAAHYDNSEAFGGAMFTRAVNVYRDTVYAVRERERVTQRHMYENNMFIENAEANLELIQAQTESLKEME